VPPTGVPSRPDHGGAIKGVSGGDLARRAGRDAANEIHRILAKASARWRGPRPATTWDATRTTPGYPTSCAPKEKTSLRPNRRWRAPDVVR
jgi:hypothetical protein